MSDHVECCDSICPKEAGNSTEGESKCLVQAEEYGTRFNIKTQAVSEVAIPMFPRNPKWVEFSPPVRLHVKYDIDDKDPLRALLAKLPDYSESQLTISQCIHIVGQRKEK
ncbi:uncharacterized protein LOC128247852 [Octopus bimaculoides]|uniref:uncharacterized protein LOC128247852 n=1 Tax=Octopus bimaculoides TaxID=37653 RepID=UPI0022E00CBB|nr:uncharacterized protein LOC128247852 [Octopus bimaculoides]